MTEWQTLNTPPPPTGYYRIGGTTGLQIHLSETPNWFHRWMMRRAFGWEWINLEKTT